MYFRRSSGVVIQKPEMANQDLPMLLSLMLFTLLYFKSSSNAAFTCNDGTSIPLFKFCDGISDCDGSDEINGSISHNVSTSLFNCTRRHGTCLLHRDYICNGIIFCNNVNLCDVGCPNYYQCMNTKQCVRRETICDENPCNGCAEDDGWPNGIGFKCIRNSRECRLPQQLLWDNVQDCDNGIDVCYQNASMGKTGRDIRMQPGVTFNTQNCFMCLDNTMIIPRQKVCDGTIDCSDLSDECLCARQPPEICDRVQLRNTGSYARCRIGQVECGDKALMNCINTTSVCNGVPECRHNLDEKFDFCQGTLPCINAQASKTKATCRCPISLRCKKKTIANLCDGMEDCNLVPGESWFVPPGFPEDECGVGCPNVSGKFNCTIRGSSGKGTPVQQFFCASRTLDVNGTVTFSGTKISNTSPLFCNGIVDCLENRIDESSCKSRFPCKSKYLISISNSKVCDGRIDCDEGSDENKQICPHRFYCPSLNGTLMSIPSTAVCDFNINCDNSHDEMNCTSDKRFYCENGKPLFVPKEKILDGRGDCSDWSDECSLKLTARENILSSKYELIANVFLRILVWIMAILALVGNAVVIVGESRTLKSMYCKSPSASLRANRMLVLNLAVADFLMGVYLFMLGIAGAVYSERYCSQAMWWTTSQPCTFMGVLVVISSETSVLTLFLLTLLRGYSVYNPIDSLTKPGFRLTIVLIATTWGISLLLSLLPLFGLHQHIFVERALVKNNPFFGSKVVHFKTAKNFTMKLLTYSPSLRSQPDSIMQKISAIQSWSQLQGFYSTLPDLSHYLNIQRFYSYYSSSSVCIPKLFVTPNDKVWEFSLTISILNFVAFLSIASIYAAVIIKTRKTVAGSSNSRDENKTLSIQRKIVRLIITNFCCWVPLTIMVFVYFSGVKIDPVAYAVSAIVLLPINCALNPLLYSNFLDKGWEAFRHKLDAARSKNMSSVGASHVESRL